MKIQGKRSSVSAEVYGIFNKKEDFKPREVNKSKDQITRIRDKMSQSFLFSALDDSGLETVIMAMEEKLFKQGETVIKQGENGDVLYLIEKGTLDCFKILKKGEDMTFLKTYQPGEAFGELALLYNAPRAATIIAKEESLLWALDRETFNHIVKDAAMKKRDKYEKFLRSVEILSSIDNYELAQISDALKVEKVKKGDYIIRQKEEGDKFYIIEDGEAYASFTKLNGTEERVMDYKQGSYFGELALIKNDLRAANVVAETDCKLLAIDRKSFKRLLGPIENILRRLSSNYTKYIGN
jgi:cAMP-dependent protein kinase regulator